MRLPGIDVISAKLPSTMRWIRRARVRLVRYARLVHLDRLVPLAENRVFLSCAVHTVLLYAVLNAWWFGAARLKHPGTSKGVETMLDFTPGAAAPQQSAPRHSHRVRRSATRALASNQPAEPDSSPAPDMEALGDGPATILFIQSFPANWPQTETGDLTGDLVIEVQIDENGRVIQTHTRRGIAAPIDDAVVATVREWLFQPAIKDGKAIRSAEELHFRFDSRHHPACGWDCLQLIAD